MQSEQFRPTRPGHSDHRADRRPAEHRPAEGSGGGALGTDEVGGSASTEQDTSVERTAVLPASADRVMAALSDPELLATWLGTCSEDGTRIRTDDGVVRRITGRERDGESIVRWTWAPEARPDDRSEVVVTLTPVGEQTRLVVRETRTPSGGAAATASARTAVLAGAADRWTGCLLALGAVLLAHAERTATV